ncbi:hypothetical protein O9992_28115 [Vibrio lentus]|nr:hypothetical protein [Vibrio lentus]
MIGMGIAIGNVLLPVVVKISFPTRIATVTSLYIYDGYWFDVGGSKFNGAIFRSHLIYANGLAIGAVNEDLVFPILALMIWLPKIQKTFLFYLPAIRSKKINHTDEKDD